MKSLAASCSPASLFQWCFIFYPLLFLSICFLYFRRSPFVAKAAIRRTLSVSPLTHENNFALSYEGWVLSEKILMKIHDSLSHRWLPQQDSAVRVDSIPWQCRLSKVQQWDHQWLWARQPCTVAFNKPNTMLFGKYTTVCPPLLEDNYAKSQGHVECEIQWVRFLIPNYNCIPVQQPPVLVDQVQMWI